MSFCIKGETMKVIDEETKKEMRIEKALEKAVAEKELLHNDVIAPAGYAPMELSSNGAFGVPKKIFIKNFSTEDTLHLSMATEELLPEYLIPILNKNIWNPDNKINVADWTEKQIVELMVRLYASFYGTTINNITFPMSVEDIEYLEKNNMTLMMEQLEKGWEPKIDINLMKIEFLDMDDNDIKNNIRITTKNKFSVVFSIPKFGDIIILKKIINEQFYQSDKKYEKLQKKIEANDESVTIDQVYEMEKYFIDKTLFITTLTKSYYLKEIEGKNIAELGYKEKIEASKDARLDGLIFKRYEKELMSLKYGINPEMEIMNPLTGNLCIRRFVFRPFNILQIILLSEFDEYVVKHE